MIEVFEANATIRITGRRRRPASRCPAQAHDHVVARGVAPQNRSTIVVKHRSHIDDPNGLASRSIRSTDESVSRQARGKRHRLRGADEPHDGKVAPPAGAKGDGLYATAPIRDGETVIAFGGYAIDRATLDELPADRRMHAIQIDDDLFLVGPHPAEPGDLVNHSCDPNCGLVGAVLVVAMRDIEPGEGSHVRLRDVRLDRRRSSTARVTPHCRKHVTGNDWKRPDLQAVRGMVLVVPRPQDRRPARPRSGSPRVRSLTAT
jgi:hypothetical protein